MNGTYVRFENTLNRIGAGSTPDSVRWQDNSNSEYRRDASLNHSLPPVTDYPIQSLNPDLLVSENIRTPALYCCRLD